MKRPQLWHGNLKDEISRQIRQMVFTGQIVPGTKIDQDALAEDFGVSKLPIRESLIALESEGLVVHEPRRGWFVDEIKPADALHGRMSPDRDGRHDEFEELNFEFHWIINSVTPAPRLRSALKLWSEAIPERFFYLMHDWPSAAHEDHDDILDALEARDAERAQRAMREHVVRGGERAVEFLTERGFWDTDERVGADTEPAAALA